jgi:hypothetical protein
MIITALYVFWTCVVIGAMFYQDTHHDKMSLWVAGLGMGGWITLVSVMALYFEPQQPEYTKHVSSDVTNIQVYQNEQGVRFLHFIYEGKEYKLDEPAIQKDHYGE